MHESENAEPIEVAIPASHRRQILLSKWRSLPSLFWSIIVGVLAVFSVLQATLLTSLGTGATIGLLVVLLSLAMVAAVVVALRQKTPTEKLATARALFAESRQRFGEREYPAAETAALRSVDLDPEESPVWNLLGRTRLRLGKPADAIEAFTRALEVNRQSDWRNIYLHNRAVAYLSSHDFGRARQDLDKCIATTPRSWTRLRWRALACLHLGDLSGALADAESSVREAPGRVINQAVLAIVAEAAGKPRLAQNAAAEASRPRPESASDYYYLGALKAFRGDSNEALRLLEISIQLDDQMMPRASFDPLWDCLRESARFKRIVSSLADMRAGLA